MIREAIAKWLDRADLTEAEALAVMEEVMRGEATPAQLAGALVALRMKGETAAELAGLARGMRGAMVAVEAAPEAVDSCGTGGDGSGTFNISTAAAFVAAGAGAVVAKHGNRSVSSRCGSADVFEALGVAIALPPERAAELLREVGLAFLFAPNFHPAMRHAAPVRRELGVRTVFNLLGPLCNPAGVKRQVVGVFSPAAQELVAGALARLGAVHALVVHGCDGLDEITLTGPTHVIEVKPGNLSRWELDPATLGLARCEPAELAGGDAAANAAVVRDLLDGKITDARREIVLLNAAAVVYVAGRAPDLARGLELARTSLASGQAREKLERLRTLAPAR